MGFDSGHGLRSQSAVTFAGKGAITLQIWPANPNQYWRLVTDAVVGGVSRGSIANETLEGREAIRMRGDVSTENNGGFVQIALDGRSRATQSPHFFWERFRDAARRNGPPGDPAPA
jgi:Complex I intermediate-associated protein 30 (CIA30)